jgi:hypothetical protein
VDVAVVYVFRRNLSRTDFSGRGRMRRAVSAWVLADEDESTSFGDPEQLN